MKLVDAQQARRILDRLVGYKISPILWRKIKSRLSAGRVQSVALRMVVEREREIENFIPVEYWTVEAELLKDKSKFRATLIKIVGKKKLEIKSEEHAKKITAELEKSNYLVSKVEHKKIKRQPVPPFITSTLQQEAWRKLHFSAKRTMRLAQELYEGLPIDKGENVGLITYMRTDSTKISSQAIKEARDYISEKYGADFVPPSPRVFKRKVKGAQEAHEAIRPTSVRREPKMLANYLTPSQLKLYELIWKRMVASQMSAAIFDTTLVEIEAQIQNQEKKYLLRATGSKLTFPGFLTLYNEGKDETEDKKRERPPLPELSKSELLKLLKIIPEQHFTKPPPHYTEATLVKALEENGIGRPSTYAPIISVLQERRYVKKENGYLTPQELGFTVTDLLKEHFPDIVDIKFTAQMEEELDEIAQGDKEWVPMLQKFYGPFEKTVKMAELNILEVKIEDISTDEVCEKCGAPMVIKEGRYGKFLACSAFPKCKNAKPLPIGVKCPECGGEIVKRRSKKGRTFYGCSNYPDCNFVVWGKPLEQKCPECGGLMVVNGKNGAKCSKCGHKGELLEER
jgi:DNA topoisomerase-1